ncbi:FAD binding domain-containing protein [Streptomyces sp. NPDC086091]|uniref:FAD binding domain-containing protein n=1 Tax=Streptomyces sp. NPDC086091 TaxID=3365751 RepID=UPI003802034B
MKLPPFAYVTPRRLGEAVSRLAEAPPGQALPLAGGQSLVPLLASRARTPRLLVDLRDLGELTGVGEHDGFLRIGAMTRQHTLATHGRVGAATPLIAAAAARTGHASVRHRGTFGGTLAHAAHPAQLVVAAYALDARLLVTGPGGARATRLRSLLDGTGLRHDEILTAVDLPVRGPGSGHAFGQLAHPVGGRPVASVAAVVDTAPDGAVLRAEVTVGTRVSRPTTVEVTHRLRDVGAAAGETVPAGREEPERHGPPAAYCRHVVRALAERVLTEAITRARRPAAGAPDVPGRSGDDAPPVPTRETP